MPVPAYPGRLEQPTRRLVWLGDSRAVMRSLPARVREELGFALYQAQIGQRHVAAKPLHGLGGGIWEAASDYRGCAYRTAYAVNIGEVIYVLHVFQKKSKTRVATPQREIELIRRRFARACQLGERR